MINLEILTLNMVENLDDFQDVDKLKELFEQYHKEQTELEQEKKYYFITYRGRGHSRSGNSIYSTWSECIDIPPMKFMLDVQESENRAEKSYYSSFDLINTVEISKIEYDEYKDLFG